MNQHMTVEWLHLNSFMWISWMKVTAALYFRKVWCWR